MAIKEHVQVHRLYSSSSVRIIRLSVLVILLVMVLFDLTQSVLPKLPLFFLSLGIMWEVYFHFSLSRIDQGISVSRNTSGNPIRSFSHAALDSYYVDNTTENVLRGLLHFPQVQFMLDHIGLASADIQIHDVPLQTLAEKAFVITGTVQGNLVTTMDVFTAYLILTEPETKLLFTHEVKERDLLEVLKWARMYAQYEDTFVRPQVYEGDGFAEQLVDGWTPETEKYTTEYSVSSASSYRGMIGRESDYELFQSALLKSESRNVLLVGEAGVGKEKMLATFAYDSHAGTLDSSLNHKKIITLLVGPLVAGTTDRAELESRLQAVIAELSHASNIILYIPELQEIVGDSSYNINLSGALLPYLKDGALPIIASLTPENYKRYVEKSSLQEVFTTISLSEPDIEVVKQILCMHVLSREQRLAVIIPIQTIDTIIKLSKKYLPDDVLPGSAVRLLEDSVQGHKVTSHELHHKQIVTSEDITHIVESKVHAPIAAPQKEEKALLLHLDQKLHERVIGQKAAIASIADAIKRVRSGVSDHVRPVSFLFLGPTGVGKTETAKALAAVYFGGEDHMIRLDMSEYVDTDSVNRLLGAPPGAGDERGELTEKVHDNPYMLLLLDEFEKAHPSILDLFLQVLSDGRLTDNKGRTVSFTDTIIIATSNAGSMLIQDAIQQHKSLDSTFHESLIKQLETEHIFKPELLNRFDGVITFNPLTEEELVVIVTLLLKEVTASMAEKDITVVFDREVIEHIARDGADPQFGARPLKRYIQDTVEDTLATLTLEEKISRGDIVHFILGADGKITTMAA